MKALGFHTYFGGMQQGVQQSLLEDLGSVENWDRALRGRRAAGVGWLTESQGAAMRPDVVYANPPCSRYSNQSTGTFTAEEKADPARFCELMDIVNLTLECDASMLWWETGPLCWSVGRDLVSNTHDLLETLWGEEVTTMLVRIDTRWTGSPQLRPRCHVIHLRGDVHPPDLVEEAQPQSTLHTVHRPRHADKAFPPKWDYNDDALEAYELAKLVETFTSRIPTLTYVQQVEAKCVLSGRQFIWGDENRWWNIAEYAALQGMNEEQAIACFDVLGGYDTLSLLSKGVSPHAARFVADNYVVPMLDPDAAPDGWDEGAERWPGGAERRYSASLVPPRRGLALGRPVGR